MGSTTRTIAAVLKKRNLLTIMFVMLLTVMVGTSIAYAFSDLVFTHEISYLPQPVGYYSEYYWGDILLSESSIHSSVRIESISFNGDISGSVYDGLPKYIYRGSSEGIHMYLRLKPSHLGTCTGYIHVETYYGNQDIPVTMTGISGTFYDSNYARSAFNPQGHDRDHAIIIPPTKIGKTSYATATITLHQDVDFSWGCNYLEDQYNSINPPFSVVQNTCTGFKSRGSTCTVKYKYSPTTIDLSGTYSRYQEAILYGSNACGLALSVWVKGTAINPNAAYTPSSLSFPDTATGQQSTEKTITISNTGTTDLLLTGKTLSDWTNYTVSSNTCTDIGNTLSPGSSCSIGIKFKPQSAGSKAATYTITTNDVDHPTLTVALSGTGTTPIPNITYTPSSLSFPDTAAVIGTSNPKTVTINNTGNGTLNFSSITVSNNHFEISSNNCGSSLAAGSSCTVNIRFDPDSVGQKTATLNISSNDPDTPTATVSLSGLSVGPVISRTPSSLSFPDTAVGQVSTTQTVTISNTGNATLSFSGISLTDTSNYQISSNNCGSSLAAGSSCQVGIKFKPQSVGSKSATLNINSNDPLHSTLTVALSGTGTQPNISRTPSSLSFPDTNVGQVSTAKTVTISNTGTGALTINSISLTDTSNYQISSNNCGSSLAAGSSCQVGIKFKPQSIGSKTAVLNISSNDPDTPTISTSLSGIGKGAAISVNPTSYNYGNVNVSSSASHQFTVSNVGNAGLDISSVMLGDSTNYQIDSDTCAGYTVAAGGNCQITVRFTPQSHGSKNTTLTIHSSLPDKAIPLQGTGMAPDINVSPLTINFGTVDQHSTPVVRQITVSNQGNLPLENLNTFLDNAIDYSISANTCGQTLAAGASCTVSLALSTDDIGTHTATLEFTSNDADENPVDVDLTGIVSAPQINVNPTTIGFGNNDIGVTATARSIQVSNLGNDDLTIDPIVLDDTTNYSIESDNCSGQTLTPTNACTIMVSFTAATAGAHQAQITINSNDPNTPSVPVSLSGYGISPQATVDPLAIDFGNVRVNDTSGIQTVTVSSTGNTPLEVSGVSLTDTVNYVKINDTCSNQIIDVGGTCKVDITFRPGSTGAKPATLQITSNDILNPQVDVALTGTGIESDIDVTPSSLSFPDTVTGQQSASQTVTVKNTGVASLNISSATIFGSGFTITAGNCNGQELQTDETCTLEIAFTPTGGAGHKTAELRINSDDPDEGQVVVALDGSAIEPDISVSPAFLDFGQQTIGIASQPQSITVTNNGSSQMSVGDITVTNPAYTLDTAQCSGTTLDPGSSCSITATFTAPSRGTFMGDIKIQSDDPDTPEKKVPVTGEGIEPDIYVAPTPLNIGMVPVGESGEKSLTVFNHGNGELTVGTIALEDNPLFSITDNACTGQTLGYGESCQVTVGFSPVAVGRIEAMLNINSNDPDTPTADIKVVAEGTVPDIDAQPAGIDFGSVTTMTEGYARTFSIRNAGKAPLVISTAVLTDNENYTIDSSDCDNATIEPGYSCHVNIKPTPKVSGPIRGYLQVNSNDPDEAQILLPLDTVSSSPELTVEPSGTILFPDTIKDGFSDPQTITLKNTGNEKLRLTSIYLSAGDNYLFDRGSCQDQIPAGESCEMTVTFNPHAEGILVSALNVESNDPVKPTVAISLSGNGLPADVHVFPRSIDFGTIGIGGSSLSSNVTVQNQGTVPLDITGIQLSNSDDFQIADDTCSGQTLQPNATCTFTAIFSPVAEQDVSGNILINTSDSNESVVTVPMQGYNPKVITLETRSLPVMSGPLKNYYGQWAVNSRQSVMDKEHRQLSESYNIWAYLKPGYTTSVNVNGTEVNSTTPVPVAENYDFGNTHGVINLPAYPVGEGTASVMVAIEKEGTPIFEIPIEGWIPEVSLLHDTWSVTQAVERITIPFAHNDHCYIVTSDDKAQDNNYNGTKCLVEWTSLPEGLENNSYPQGLIGYVNGEGEQTIAATLYMYDGYGHKHEVGTLEHQITTTPPDPIEIKFTPAYGLPQSTTQGEYFTWTGEGANAGTISILAKYRSLHVDITGTALAQDESYDIASNRWGNTIKTAMVNAWQTGDATVSVSYTRLPESKTTLVLNLKAVPRGPSSQLDPYQGDSRNDVVLVGHLGIKDTSDGTYTYDEQRDGRWNISLTNYNGSVVYYGPVEYGSENIAADGLFNLDLGLYDAGVYSMRIKAEPAGAGTTVNRIFYSAPAAIVIKDGSPIEGYITSRTPYAPAPFTASANLYLDDWQRKQDIGSVTWYESIDGGSTYTEADIPQSSYQVVTGYTKRIEEPQTIWVKAEIKNAWSDEVFETEPFKLQAYYVPTLTVEGANTTLVGHPVELNGTTDLENSVISWKIYAYSMSDDNLVTESAGNSVTITPDQVGRYYVSVTAKQSDAPNVQGAEIRTVFILESLAPTLRPPQVTGSSYTETGKEVELKATVVNPFTIGNRSSDLTLKGEWVLPDGSTIAGGDLAESTTDTLQFVPRAEWGDTQTVSYRIWVDEMSDIEATGMMQITTWTYTWPEWSMNIVVSDPTAPTIGRINVTAADQDAYRALHGEPITFTWHYPEKVEEVSRFGNGSSVNVRFLEGGQYELVVDVSDTRGNTTTLTSELVQIQPGPTLEAALTLNSTDPDSPTMVCGDLTLVSLPKGDYLSSINYVLDGQPIDSCSGIRCCTQVATSGEHTMSANMVTKLGSEKSVQETITLQEPPTPNCHLEISGSVDSSLKAEMICNTLPSGFIQQYKWQENGNDISYSYPSKVYPDYLLEHYDLQSITVTAITNKGKESTQSWTAPSGQ